VNSTYRPPAGVGFHPRKTAEHHVAVSDSVVGKAILSQEGKRIDPDLIAYAAGPGLGPCLRIGATVARALASFLEKPLVPIHHGVAHLDIGMSLGHTRDPLAVLVSGGHTAILVHTRDRWRVYGETQDITLGNLLDIFAREANIGPPEGSVWASLSIERLAKKGRRLLDLPYTVKGNDVAYSGLLTAAINQSKNGADPENVCFSLQEIAFSMLAEAVERSLVQTKRSEVLVAGGVAANKRLKEMLESVAADHSASIYTVPLEYSGDCGAQIACSGSLAFKHGFQVSNDKSFVIPRWRMDEVDVPWIPRS
jgi:N6-L-threonylcarbamoyladenine synthase